MLERSIDSDELREDWSKLNNKSINKSKIERISFLVGFLIEKRLRPSSIKFSYALTVGDNLSPRRIIHLGNHSVQMEVLNCQIFSWLTYLVLTINTFIVSICIC